MPTAEEKERAYWKQRYIDNAARVHDEVDKATEELRQTWAEVMKDLQNDIEAEYSRFASEQGLTMADAKKLMTTKELAGLKLSLRKFEELAKANANGQWEKELSAASSRVRISRLEAMQLQIRNYLWEAYQGTENAAAAALRDAYTSAYYHNIYETQQAAGKFSPIEEIPAGDIDAILSHPWAADGREWSDRIWSNREQVTAAAQGELLRSIIQGKGPVEASERLAQKMGVGKYQAVRLIQTETTYITTAANTAAFKASGVDRVEYVATLEAHTCETCGALDGKVLSLKDVAAGMTAPPMHPNCRCVLVPYFDDNKTRRWMKDPDTFERKTVANTTFEQWKKKYIKPPKPKQAAQQPPAKKGFTSITGNNTIKRDKGSELYKGFGPQHFENMIADLETSSAPEPIKELWGNSYQNVRVAPKFRRPKGHGAWASGDEIYIDIDYHAKGDIISAPYQAAFHESGHALDYFFGQLFRNSSELHGSTLFLNHFSAKWRQGAFLRAIRKDASDLIADRTKKTRARYPKEYKNNPKLVYIAINVELRNYKALVRGNVSDILGGATLNKINGLVGHETKYWSSVWADDNLATEAFAEFTDSAITNPESFELMKKYLPTAYSEWMEMIKWLNEHI